MADLEAGRRRAANGRGLRRAGTLYAAGRPSPGPGTGPMRGRTAATVLYARLRGLGRSPRVGPHGCGPPPVAEPGRPKGPAKRGQGARMRATGYLIAAATGAGSGAAARPAVGIFGPCSIRNPYRKRVRGRRARSGTPTASGDRGRPGSRKARGQAARTQSGGPNCEASRRSHARKPSGEGRPRGRDLPTGRCVAPDGPRWHRSGPRPPEAACA